MLLTKRGYVKKKISGDNGNKLTEKETLITTEALSDVNCGLQTILC